MRWPEPGRRSPAAARRRPTQPFSESLQAADQIDNFEFRAFGPFDPMQLPFLLGSVDVVVVPAVGWESFSIVMREAFACGVPVIASRLGALPEGVRDGENGLLFDAGSSTQLAALLQMLDSDRSRLEALREGIRATDWISVQERTTRIRKVMVEALTNQPASTAPISDFVELSILRDALADISSAA